MPSLTLEQLEKCYPDGHVAASNVSLSVRDGEFVSLLGPSGCGKTTVLRMVAGLLAPTGGRVLIAGRDVTHLASHRRNIGLVFQSYALFPHLTVFENVAFGLRRQGIRAAELTRRVEGALASVRLSGYHKRFPRELSGGQQQRVAVARSIAPRPSILLFDEPLSNLDAALREEMRIELCRLQRDVGITTLFVTHDQMEAMAMADRVCVMADGVVQQFATPEDIYHRPATRFVAGFIGQPNRLRGIWQASAQGGWGIQLGDQLHLAVARTPTDVQAGRDVAVILRQEDLQLLHADHDHTGLPAYAGRISLRSFIGARVQYVICFGDVDLLAEVPVHSPHASLAVGAHVQVAIDPAHVWFDTT